MLDLVWTLSGLCLDFVHFISRFWTLFILTRSRKGNSKNQMYQLRFLDKVQTGSPFFHGIAWGIKWTKSRQSRMRWPCHRPCRFLFPIKWTGLCLDKGTVFPWDRPCRFPIKWTKSRQSRWPCLDKVLSILFKASARWTLSVLVLVLVPISRWTRSR